MVRRLGADVPWREKWGFGALAMAVMVLSLTAFGSSPSLAGTSSRRAAPLGTVSLSDVTCVTSSDCWAVGDRTSGNGVASMSSESFIEHWTGHSWAVVKAPRVGSGSYLAGVSCISALSCWAVGGTVTTATGDTGLIDHWQGRSWLQAPASNLGAADLYGVTCANSSRCWAVGDSDSGRPIIATWDGRIWVDVTTPVEGLVNLLHSVSCPATRTCWAVGDSLTSGTHQYVPLVLKWNGVQWSVTKGATGPLLVDVACLSASNCWLVGATGPGRSVLQHWNGVNWTTTQTPNVSGNSPLLSVACTGATTCFAVGGTGQAALIERWDGRSWRIVSSPLPKGRAVFASITCFENHTCWAVGGFVGDTVEPLIDYWSGSQWRAVSL